MGTPTPPGTSYSSQACIIYLIKGCQRTMHRMALLEEAANAKPKRKRERGRTHIAQDGALTVEERLDRVRRIKDPSKDIGHAPLYKMSLEELEAVKQHLEANLSKGFIVPSTPPFASPVLVARSACKLRFCVDYRKLNTLSKKGRYPLPFIDELMDRLHGARYLTKLDVRHGFHRIRMSAECEDLTTFRTRYGSFKYRVMPFGLTNGRSVFQRFVNTTFFDDLDRFITAVATITKWTEPTTVQGVLSFPGFCNFHRRFTRAYSQIAKPLYRLSKKDTLFVRTPQCQEAFEKLKSLLTRAPVLCRYDPSRNTRRNGCLGAELEDNEQEGEVEEASASTTKTCCTTL
ncbi:hypothetical protein VTO42DRAFT_4405 [Malbranchea cinnamomea]